MFGSSRTNQRAFTLVEILVVLAIFAVLMIFFFSFNNFFQGKGQVDKTRKRMEKIVSAAQKYYLSHENLPVFHEGLPVSAGDVPVDALNIEARYRLALCLEVAGKSSASRTELESILNDAKLAPPHFRKSQKIWLDEVKRELA